MDPKNGVHDGKRWFIGILFGGNAAISSGRKMQQMAPLIIVEGGIPPWTVFI